MHNGIEYSIKLVQLFHELGFNNMILMGKMLQQRTTMMTKCPMVQIQAPLHLDNWIKRKTQCQFVQPFALAC